MRSEMSFRFTGLTVSEGRFDAADAVSIITALQQLAHRVARIELDSAELGRPNRDIDRIARLEVGVSAGSSVLEFAGVSISDALDLELADEVAFDETFSSIITRIGTDDSPRDLDPTTAARAGALITALQKTSGTIDFAVDGARRWHRSSSELSPDAWLERVSAHAEPEFIDYIGVLVDVDIDRDELAVRDDVGFRVKLRNVAEPLIAGPLLGEYVIATGTPRRDRKHRVTALDNARIEPFAHPVEGLDRRMPTLQEQLRTKPGPSRDDASDFTDDEVDAFFTALREL